MTKVTSTYIKFYKFKTPLLIIKKSLYIPI